MFSIVLHSVSVCVCVGAHTHTHILVITQKSTLEQSVYEILG